MARHGNNGLIGLKQSGLCSVPFNTIIIQIQPFRLLIQQLQSFRFGQFTLDCKFRKQNLFLIQFQKTFVTGSLIAHFQVVKNMPNLKILKQRRRFRTNFWTYFYRTYLSVFHHFDATSFQFTTGYQIFLAFQRTLVEDNDITQDFLSVWRQLRMILGLFFPNGFKFIQIILTIEYFILYTKMRIFVQL